MKKVIEEGLRLFGLTEYHMDSIVVIPLTPGYANTFAATYNNEFPIAFIGDAAM